MVCEPPLHVTRDGPNAYRVRSEEHHNVHYAVALDDPEFPQGACTCTDWDTRRAPAVRRHETHDVTCKHIRRVRSEIRKAEFLCNAAGLPAQYADRLIPSLEQWVRCNS